jgi:hypothetical protein
MKKTHETIEVMVLDADGAPYLKEIKNELSAFQKIVDGRIEVVMIEVPTREGKAEVCCVLNEEGKLMELEPNFAFPIGQGYWDVIVGNVFFCGDLWTDEGKEFRSLTNDEFMGIIHFLQTGKKALLAIMKKYE